MHDSEASTPEKKSPASSKVTIATTEPEKEEIYRLRYDVYIEEMDGGQRHPEADDSKRQTRDELDEHAVHFYVRQDDDIIGCARVNLRRDGPWECEDRFELEKFSPAVPNQVAMASRFVLHPRARESVVMMQLSYAMAEFLCEQEQRFCFLDCHPKLMPLYSRLGFRIYKPGFKHPKYAYVIPMVIVFTDMEHLTRVGSPLVSITRRYPETTQWRDLLLKNFPAVAHTFMSANLDVAAFWALLGGSLLGPAADITPSDILAGLTEAETKLLVSMGQIVICHAGDAILCIGEEGREIFLILDGNFQVLGEKSSDDQEVTTVQLLVPGQIFGETEFLTAGRRCSTVVALEDSTFLVLNAKALDRVVTAEPHLAAKLFRNLARIVEIKYSELIKS